MADLLSQNDLDALWATNSNEVTEKAEPKPESDADGGISQSDLDALFGALGGGTAESAPAEADQPSAGGLSQNDLDALWGGLTEAAAERAEPTVATEESSPSPIGENLSQDDIDRLLAEMGR